jgi:hypothetical protein
MKVGLGELHQAIPLVGTFTHILPTFLKIVDFLRIIYRGRVLIVVRPLGHPFRSIPYSALVGVVVDPVDNIYAKIILVIERAKPPVIIGLYGNQSALIFVPCSGKCVCFPMLNLVNVTGVLYGERADSISYFLE